MSFTAIGSTEIQSGKPASTTVLGKIKSNFDDHESRLQVIESGTSVVYPPLTFNIGGPYGLGSATNDIIQTTVNFPMHLTGIRLLIGTAGTTGTTQVDVKFKRGAGAWTSILTTLPSVSYTAGNSALSTNGVVNPTYAYLQAGDILRLDLTSIQLGGIGFVVRIDYSGA